MRKLISSVLLSSTLMASYTLASPQKTVKEQYQTLKENECAQEEAQIKDFVSDNEAMASLQKIIEEKYQTLLKQNNKKEETLLHCQWINEVMLILRQYDYKQVPASQKDKRCTLYAKLFNSYEKRLNYLYEKLPKEDVAQTQKENTLYENVQGKLFLTRESFQLSQNQMNIPSVFKTLRFNGQAYLGECGDVQLKVMVFDNDNVKNTLLNQMRNKAVVEVIKDPYQMPSFVHQQFKDNNYVFAYDETLDYLNEAILSFSASTYVYTGGAHGNTAIEKIAFDLKRQKALTLEDIFTQKEIPKLMQLAKMQFLKDLNLSEGKSWEELGYWFKKEDSVKVEKKWLLDDGFYLPKNFNIDNEGITFLYQPYEVTCYACGIPQFKLHWKDVRPYLVKGGVVDKSFSK